MKNSILGMLLACTLAGCAIAPTNLQLAHGDFGTSTTQDEAVAAVNTYFASHLKDPMSAQISCGDVNTGWMRAMNGLNYGYFITCSVNAKNSYGGYTGAEDYNLLMHDGVVTIAREVAPFKAVGGTIY